MLNDVVAHTFISDRIPVAKESPGLSRLEGKKPDSLPLILWQWDKSLTWHVTVISKLMDSYLHVSVHQQPERKQVFKSHRRVVHLSTTTCPCDTPCSAPFLFQWMFVVLQRFNAVFIHESFLDAYPTSSHFNFCFYSIGFYRAMHFSAKRGIAIACRLSVRPSVCLSVCL